MSRIFTFVRNKHVVCIQSTMEEKEKPLKRPKESRTRFIRKQSVLEVFSASRRRAAESKDIHHNIGHVFLSSPFLYRIAHYICLRDLGRKRSMDVYVSSSARRNAFALQQFTLEHASQGSPLQSRYITMRLRYTISRRWASPCPWPREWKHGANVSHLSITRAKYLSTAWNAALAAIRRDSLYRRLSRAIPRSVCLRLHRRGITRPRGHYTPDTFTTN